MPNLCHAECRPERVTIAFSELCRTNLIRHCVVLPARRACADELRLCHDNLYVSGTLALRRMCTAMVEKFLRFCFESVQQAASEAQQSLFTQKLQRLEQRQDSVYLNSHSVDCALLATGCTLDAVDAVACSRARHSLYFLHMTLRLRERSTVLLRLYAHPGIMLNTTE